MARFGSVQAARFASERWPTSGRYARPTSSEYADQDRQTLRRLLLDGAATAPTEPVDEGYFDGLRDRVRSRAAK